MATATAQAINISRSNLITALKNHIKATPRYNDVGIKLRYFPNTGAHILIVNGVDLAMAKEEIDYVNEQIILRITYMNINPPPGSAPLQIAINLAGLATATEVELEQRLRQEVGSVVRVIDAALIAKGILDPA